MVISDITDKPIRRGLDGNIITEDEYKALVVRYEEVKRKEFVALKTLKTHEETHKAEFYKPYLHQQQAFDLLYAGKKYILLIWANKAGKTVTIIHMICGFINGREPWGNKRESIFHGKPTKGRILCVDWESQAKSVIVPYMREYIPREWYNESDIKRNQSGVEYFWKFKNGSTIQLLTHNTDTQSMEGWDGDWVWADECLPKEKFAANTRGLIVRGGVFILSMTSVRKEATWVLDDLISSTNPEVKNNLGYICNVPIEANLSLTKEAIATFASTLDEDEKEARLKGGWYGTAGRILKEFDNNKHVVEPFDIPPDWIVTPMIDLALRYPQAIGFYATDRMNRTWIIHEIWEEEFYPIQIAETIIRLKITKPWRIERVFIDPLSKGDDKYMKNRIDVEDAYSIIESQLRKFGITLDVGSKDKPSGIANIKEDLKGKYGEPLVKIFNTCTRHIYEIMRWSYDDDGLPSKEGWDDFMENWYRFTLTGTKYYDPEIYTKKIDYEELVLA